MTLSFQVGHCATIWQHDNTQPWQPAFGRLQHLYFNTFAVVGEHLDVGAGTPLLSFFSTYGDGLFDRFESPLEDAVSPIVFVRACSQYRGQGTGFSQGGVPSKTFAGGVSQDNAPLPRRHIYV